MLTSVAVTTPLFSPDTSWTTYYEFTSGIIAAMSPQFFFSLGSFYDFSEGGTFSIEDSGFSASSEPMIPDLRLLCPVA